MLKGLYKMVHPWATSNKFQLFFNKIIGVLADRSYRVYVWMCPIKHQSDYFDGVVSLTTYPGRINEVYYCLQSLLRQQLKPKKLVLWLAKSQFPNGFEDVPSRIRKLRKKGLEIRFTFDYRSYKKIYPALEYWSDTVIITADDDTLYPEDWLKNLVRVHEVYPECVVCYRAHEITTYNGDINPYNKWNGLSPNVKGPSSQLMPVGVGGVLYPKGYFKGIAFDYDTIKKLAPTTDDIWLKMVGLLRNIKAVKVYLNSKEWFTVRGSQRGNLTSFNVGHSNANDAAISNLKNYYNISLDVLED